MNILIAFPLCIVHIIFQLLRLYVHTHYLSLSSEKKLLISIVFKLQLQIDFQKIIDLIISKTPSSRSFLKDSVGKIALDWPVFAPTIFELIKCAQNVDVQTFLNIHKSAITDGKKKDL